MIQLTDEQSRLLASQIIEDTDKKLYGKGITADSSEYVHVLACGTSPLMLDVVRTAIMRCHFPNFHDERPDRRTHITILVKDADEEKLKDFEQSLSDPFGNLPRYCVHRLRMVDEDRDLSAFPIQESFVDIEFDIVGLASGDEEDYLLRRFAPEREAIVSIFAEDGDLSDYAVGVLSERHHRVAVLPAATVENVPAPDPRLEVMAQQVNMIYDSSVFFNEVYLKDIHKAEAYSPAMNSFLLHTPALKRQKAWDGLSDPSLRLSNIYCVESFEYKLQSIGWKRGEDVVTLRHKVHNHLADLSRTEHARWNVERLVQGYRPLNDRERYLDEITFGAEQAAERKRLKKAEHVHIDLCSYNRLCLIDHSALKYDVFLTLAIPEIIHRSERETAK